MTEENKTGEQKVDVSEPILINLGKQRRKRIKNLMKGKGKLWNEVEDVIDEVSLLLGDELEGKTIVPLILVYRRRPKRKRRFFGL
ncbi:hypothetical protein ACFLYP_01620 [Chloroflexota bacterium]